MRKWLKVIRWQEWYDTKLPLIVIIAYYAIAKGSDRLGWEAVIRIGIYGAGLLAFGYLINDISDEELDRLVGKRRGVHSFSKTQAWLLAAILVIMLPFALWPYLVSRPYAVGSSLSLSIFAAAAYSIQPFRFKERSWLGLITASAAQRTIPAFVAAVSLDVLEPATWAMILVYFMNGLRYIILHQVIDAENDRLANVQTYLLSNNRLSKGIDSLSFLLLGEIIILLLMPLSLALNLWWIGIAFWPYAIYWVINFLRQRKGTHPLDYDHMPLQTYYFIVWPAILAFAAALANTTLWPLLLLEITWKLRLWQPFLRRTAMIK